jgi:hypothetical protein
MRLEQVQKILQAEVILGADRLSQDVPIGCGSDLMSDVLAFIKPGALLLTGLTNTQAIRTAEMAEVKAICFVRGKHPMPEAVALAWQNGIVLLKTNLPMFEACGRLYQQGLTGCSEREA